MSTNSTIYKSIIGKKKCKCGNGSSAQRYFKFLENIIKHDEETIHKCNINYDVLSSNIDTLRKDVRPHNKIIEKKKLELESYRKHKQYVDEIKAIINECNKNIGNKNELINIYIKDQNDLLKVQTSIRQEIHESHNKLILYKTQFSKTGCICRWNNCVNDTCAVCFTDCKLFAISCKNNHFFVGSVSDT
jgi:hypothetical protein